MNQIFLFGDTLTISEEVQRFPIWDHTISAEFSYLVSHNQCRVFLFGITQSVVFSYVSLSS